MEYRRFVDRIGAHKAWRRYHDRNCRIADPQAIQGLVLDLDRNNPINNHLKSLLVKGLHLQLETIFQWDNGQNHH